MSNNLKARNSHHLTFKIHLVSASQQTSSPSLPPSTSQQSPRPKLIYSHPPQSLPPSHPRPPNSRRPPSSHNSHLNKRSKSRADRRNSTKTTNRSRSKTSNNSSRIRQPVARSLKTRRYSRGMISKKGSNSKSKISLSHWLSQR